MSLRSQPETCLRLRQNFNEALQSLRTELAVKINATDVMEEKKISGLKSTLAQKLTDTQTEFLESLFATDPELSVKFTRPVGENTGAILLSGVGMNGEQQRTAATFMTLDVVVKGTSWDTGGEREGYYGCFSGTTGCLMVIWVISIFATAGMAIPLGVLFLIPFWIGSLWKKSRQKQLLKDFDTKFIPKLRDWANDIIHKAYPTAVPVPAPAANTLAEAHGNWVLRFLPNIGKQAAPPECYQALQGLFWRHLLWTLWFWIPFGAIFGWLHLILKSFRKRYLAFAALYSLVLLVPYSNGFWQVNILAWVIGLVHCYATFRSTFRYMLESTDGRHYESNKLDGKYNLNTIDYKTFEAEGWENAALPVLINRHIGGQFRDMSAFFRRIDPWIDPSWEAAFSKNFDAVVVSNRTKFLSYSILFIAPVLVLCFLGGMWMVYAISPPEVKETLVPHIQRQIYSLVGWDIIDPPLANEGAKNDEEQKQIEDEIKKKIIPAHKIWQEYENLKKGHL